MSNDSPNASGIGALGRAWDLVVVGAGPAGASAARRAALGGASALLVDRAVFPRAKVCGGCLSPSGMIALREIKLDRDAARMGVPLREFELHARGRKGRIAMGPGGVAVRREEFDGMLVRAAGDAGACVRHGVSARLVRSDASGGVIALTGEEMSVELSARVVLVADGLGGSFLPRGGVWTPTIWKRSRIGLGARIGAADPVGGGFPEAGVVAMHIGRNGYVGMVRLADGSIDVGAGVSAEFVRTSGSPGEAVRAIVREAGGGAGLIGADLRWHGTPALTRRRIVEHGAVFVAGDSAGYVEPLTGEGMSWAIRGGIAGADHAMAWLAGHARAGDWTRAYREMFRVRRWGCAAVALGARSPRLAAGVVAATGVVPTLGPLVMGLFAGPWNGRAVAGGTP